ncbi:hypothetical protein ACFWNK_00670 [Streptomyces sp. NPDC058417]|uniref:hypothetical protein n=1 Tax=unclassified Streptomyces TaxID=2593676 RepID=UPI003665D730
MRSTARLLPRGRSWLRVLVLLLAVLLPTAPTGAAASAPAAAEIVEYDVSDTAARPAPAVRRTAAVRPCHTRPVLAAPPGGAPPRPVRPSAPRPPYVLDVLRAVVLRC